MSKSPQKTSRKKTTQNKESNASVTTPKLLDSGTYGCVINPPLYKNKIVKKIIIPYKNKKNSDIAKIYKNGKEDFSDEIELIEKIQIIDPKNKFTTKLKGAMVIFGDEIKDDTIQNCLRKDNSFDTYDSKDSSSPHMNDTYYTLILENGGVRTDKVYSLTYHEFLSKFKIFLSGMLKLQENDLVHLDIKPANVLISDKKINLIDFGLMTNFDSLFTQDNSHILKYANVYPYYPPEFYLAYLYLKGIPKFVNKQDILEWWSGEDNHNEINKYFESKMVNKNANLKQTYTNGVKELFNIIKNKIENDIIDVSEIFSKDMARKTDVFSISYIIAALNKNITFSSDSSERNKEQAFIDDIYQKCFEINPFQRISMQELYEEVANELKSKTSSKRGTTKQATKMASSNASRGGNMKPKKIFCSMVPKYILRVEMDPEIKQKARNIKKRQQNAF